MKNIFLTIFIPAILVGLTSGSTFANQLAKRHSHHLNYSAHFQKQEAALPHFSSGYQPPTSPQFSDEFGS